MAVVGVVAAVVLVGAAVAVVRTVTSDDGVAWRIGGSDGGAHRLVADDETVCGSNDDADIVCLDAADGHELFRQPGPSEAALLTIVDGVVLTGRQRSGDPQVTAYSRDGQEMWTASVLAPVDPPVAERVVLTIPDTLQGWRALDLSTGDPLWEWSPDIDRPGSLSVGQPETDGTWFYVTVAVAGPNAGEFSTELVAIDPVSGDERWRTTLDTTDRQGYRRIMVQDAATLDDSTAAVIVGDYNRDRRLVVVRSETGDIVEEEGLTAGPAVVAGLDGVAVVLLEDRLQGYTSDGRLLWTTTVPGMTAPSDDLNARPNGDLLSGHGRLYVNAHCCDDGGRGLWAVDTRTGDIDLLIDDDVGSVVLTRRYFVAEQGCCGDSDIQAHEPPG